MGEVYELPSEPFSQIICEGCKSRGFTVWVRGREIQIHCRECGDMSVLTEANGDPAWEGLDD